MDLEWPGCISIPERAITIIIGPSSILEEGLNSSSGMMRRYPFLYVCSNYSGVLPNLHRTTFEFSVRRGFTSDQIATIINECNATYLIIEHDPSLYENDKTLIPSVISRLKTFARNEGTVVMYSRNLDRFMRSLIRASTRVYVYADWANVIRNSQLKKQQKRDGPTRRIVSRQVRLNQVSRPEVSHGDLESGLADLGAPHRGNAFVKVGNCVLPERSDVFSPADEIKRHLVRPVYTDAADPLLLRDELTNNLRIFFGKVT